MDEFEQKGPYPAMRALHALLVAAAITAAPLPAVAQSPSTYRLLTLDGHEVKWGAPKLGTGGTVTYALIDRPMIFAGARNCASMTPIDHLLAANGIDRARFTNELKAAVGAWSAVADITFVPGDSAAADILIGAEGVPRGRAFTNVAYDTSAGTPGPRSIEKSLICLNPLQPWKIGFNGDLKVYDLRYTLTHELGHAIGLNHPGATNELMYFRYSEAFRTPQVGDMTGVAALYGPAQVPVASAPAAKPQPAAARKITPVTGQAALR